MSGIVKVFFADDGSWSSLALAAGLPADYLPNDDGVHGTGAWTTVDDADGVLPGGQASHCRNQLLGLARTGRGQVHGVPGKNRTPNFKRRARTDFRQRSIKVSNPGTGKCNRAGTIDPNFFPRRGALCSTTQRGLEREDLA